MAALGARCSPAEVRSTSRDRAATFERHLVPKYLRRLPDFDEKALLFYSRGFSTRDIRAHLKDLYQSEVSEGLGSSTTLWD